MIKRLLVLALLPLGAQANDDFARQWPLQLSQPDAAAHEVLVGVQNQVQQVLMGRHGQEAVHLHGGDVREEVVQFVVGVLGGVEQVAVKL